MDTWLLKRGQRIYNKEEVDTYYVVQLVTPLSVLCDWYNDDGVLINKIGLSHNEVRKNYYTFKPEKQ